MFDVLTIIYRSALAFFALIANITMTITTNINFCLTFLIFQFGIHSSHPFFPFDQT